MLDILHNHYINYIYIYVFENPYMLTLHSYIYSIYIYIPGFYTDDFSDHHFKAYVLDREGRPESEVPLLALLSKPMQRELRFARYEGCLREIGFSRYLSHCTWVIRQPGVQLPIWSMVLPYMVTFIYHQYTPVMLAYIPAPWILWVIVQWG